MVEIGGISDEGEIPYDDIYDSLDILSNAGLVELVKGDPKLTGKGLIALRVLTSIYEIHLEENGNGHGISEDT